MKTLLIVLKNRGVNELKILKQEIEGLILFQGIGINLTLKEMEVKVNSIARCCTRLNIKPR